MATVEPLILDGCAPTPLASYLKALGVLRLISSDTNHVNGKAADPEARGWWENECFCIRTVLDRNSLCQFFLSEYMPSPIIAPWNGRAGFLEGEHEVGEIALRPKAERVVRMESSQAHRLRNLRVTMKALRENRDIQQYNRIRADRKDLENKLGRLTGDEKRDAEDRKKVLRKREKLTKAGLLPQIRSTTDSQHLAYLDTCYALSSDNFSAPLLVGGGVDGSREFGSDFVEALDELFDFHGGTLNGGLDAELNVALFAARGHLVRRGSLGLFTPQQSGLKSTTGFEVRGSKDIYPLNSWDVVLTMEGTMAFAGAVTRRWSTANAARAAFPFTFESIGAGAGGLSSVDPNRPRGEIWTPLWTKPATYSEIEAVFAEGRLTLGQRSARTGLDAARSVARLGQARGISGFERYSLIQPDRKMPYQATPLGRFNAPDRPHRDLVEDLESGGWLQSAQRLAHGKLVSAHGKLTMRRLEDALFRMTEPNGAAEGTREALVALGRFVAWVATNPRSRETLGPPPILSAAWARTADDASPEFRVAVALAGLGLRLRLAVETSESKWLPRTGETMPMACHFAPIDGDRFAGSSHPAWTSETNTPSLVWGTCGLILNLIAVLERRLIDATMRGLHDKPLLGATYADIGDIVAFLCADFDDARCAALLAGLVWTRPTRLPAKETKWLGSVPFAYCVLKPIFTPDQTLRRIGVLSETARMPIPPGLVPRLRTGGACRDGRAIDRAVRSALVRARASGIPSPFDSSLSRGRQGIEKSSRFGAGIPADRLAAAMIIPVADHALASLLDRAYPGVVPEPNTQSNEDATNAA